MLITIREIAQTAETPATFSAEIRIDNGPATPITITNPFSEAEEQRAEWYYEQWLNMPFINQVKARESAESLRTYGETLFKQLFTDPKLYARYYSAVSRRQPIAFEISGSPAFHELHWEAIRDPEQAQPFAIQAEFTRKNEHPQTWEAEPQPSDQLNILLVVARPHRRDDVGYRTISRPLIEAVAKAQLPTHIHIVRPGSYEALARHLEEKGAGYYHILHLDLHGALLTHTQYEQFAEKAVPFNRLSYRFDHAPVEAFDGQQGFLFFDGEEVGKAHPIPASVLGELLQTYQLPIVVLNACQSGKQVGASESSLGSQLMAYGVQLVVAMGYSVTVTAAEKLMTTLYKALLEEKLLAEAIRVGRWELYHDKARRAGFNEQINLEDWLLPVVYQNRAVSLDIRGVRFLPDATLTYQRPNQAYGFFGRDVDVLEIEHHLVTGAPLLVQGMGGAGKSTLLHHLGWWWQITRWVNKVFYFGYDQTAYTRDQIVTTIGHQLWGKQEYISEVQPQMPDVQAQRVAKQLQAERHALILDNVESITGNPLSIPNTLNADEQVKLRDWLVQVKGGKTMLLLGSRSDEAWLEGAVLQMKDRYELRGLDKRAQEGLLQAMVTALGVRHYTQKQEHLEPLRQLTERLGGYPLAMEVVLSNLRHTPPAQLLAQFERAEIKIDPKAEKGDKTESVVQCIDYAHRQLPPADQQLLLILAPFTHVFWSGDEVMNHYIEMLQQEVALTGWAWERVPKVVEQAKRWGLLQAHESGRGFLQIQPVLPYYLGLRVNAPEQAEVRGAIESAFCRHYNGLGRQLAEMAKQNQEPQQKQLGLALIGLEQENCLRVVALALRERGAFVWAYQAVWVYWLALQRHDDIIALSERVWQAREQYPADLLQTQLGEHFSMVLDRLAAASIETKQYAKAEEAYLQALDLDDQLTHTTPEQKAKSKASTLHQLGIVAEEQRQWDSAETYYQQSLAIFKQFNDLHHQATALHQLGRVAQEQRQWEAAESYYQQSLAINKQFNDVYGQASTLHQLGMVAQEQRQWDSAETYYQQSLAICKQFNDLHPQATVLHQLGMVAQKQRQWDSAETYYQQSLAIKKQFNDVYGQASTLHQLGIVAQEQRQWDSAETYYQQSLAIYKQFNDVYGQASTLHQLGRVAQEQRQWDSAESYSQQSLAIKKQFNDVYNQASTLHNLGMVAQEQRQWDSAESYYQQSLAIFKQFNDLHPQATVLHQLGRVAEGREQWQQATDYLFQDLQISLQFNDEHGTGITMRSLARVWQTVGESHPAIATSIVTRLAKLGGISPAEVEAWLKNDVP